MTQEDRDRLASALTNRLCPLCASRLAVAKPKYGWGAMGAQVRCTWCGLQLRLPWMPLKRAILKLAKQHRTVRS